MLSEFLGWVLRTVHAAADAEQDPGHVRVFPGPPPKAGAYR